MPREGTIGRRKAVALMATAAGALSVSQNAVRGENVVEKGKLKQSVCKWCYRDISLADLSREASKIGVGSIELLEPSEWPVVQEAGLTCAMANGPGGITVGWNRTKNHDDLVRKSEERLPLIAEAGLPNMIVFSGNRQGLPDSEGLENCERGMKRIIPLAEKQGVTICMELLNSKRDHQDYQCDRTSWGVELVKRIGSDRFKLLYDIYHMQIMEGDIIETIQNNIDYIAHFHTGGVPGRGEIDETQELNYRKICAAIVETGFQGYLAQEFVPKRDPMTSLQQAVEICDV